MQKKVILIAVILTAAVFLGANYFTGEKPAAGGSGTTGGQAEGLNLSEEDEIEMIKESWQDKGISNETLFLAADEIEEQDITGIQDMIGSLKQTEKRISLKKTKELTAIYSAYLTIFLKVKEIEKVQATLGITGDVCGNLEKYQDISRSMSELKDAIASLNVKAGKFQENYPGTSTELNISSFEDPDLTERMNQYTAVVDAVYEDC